MQYFITLGQPLLGEKYVAQKEKKIIPKNSGHFVPQQRLRAAHTLRSDQNLIQVFPVTHYYYAGLMEIKANSAFKLSLT